MALRSCLIAFLAALLVLGPVSFADQLVRSDGKRLDGRVVAEDGQFITFETNAGGISMRQRIARAQVKAIHREAREGPGYAPIPLIGGIGQEVTADAFAAAVEAARASRPRYIVLMIDTHGGDIEQMAGIIDVIARNQDLHFIAYVRRALSAGAIIAMSCPEIFLTPGATIGAAVPYQVGPDGIPKAVEAKFESAIRAHMRAAAGLGGHDDLWVRGMTELDLELRLRALPGQAPRLFVREPTAPRPAATSAPGAPATTLPADAHQRVVKRPGQILTVTAEEAKAYGLSRETVSNIDGIRAAMKLKAWHKADERGWFVMTNKADAVTRQRKQRERLERTLTERRDYIDRHLPELMRLNAQIDRAAARLAAAKSRLEQIEGEMKERAEQLARERQLELRRASIAANPIQNARRINQEFEAKRQALIAEYKPEADRLVATGNEAAAEMTRLDEQRRVLVASAPMTE